MLLVELAHTGSSAVMEQVGTGLTVTSVQQDAGQPSSVMVRDILAVGPAPADQVIWSVPAPPVMAPPVMDHE